MKKQTLEGKTFWTKSRTFLLFLIPGVALYVFFTIVPIIMGIKYSFTDWNGFAPSYNFVGLKNYIRIFQDKIFLNSLNFTFRYTVALVILLTLGSLLTAIFLNSQIKAKSFFKALYFFPAVLSMLTLGLIFNQIYTKAFPVLADVTGFEFLRGSLSSPTKAFWGVLYVQIWQGLAIPTIFFLTGLQSIPEEQIEAAQLEGAGGWKVFTKIKIPFLYPTLTVVLILALKSGVLAFDNIKAMTEGGPAGSTISVAFIIYLHGFTEMRFSNSIAESLFMGIIICIISAFQIKINNKKKVDL